MSNFSTQILAWFDEQKRTLPWRKDPRDPYAVWVSEIMLQQTQVATVIPYFQNWLSEFPDYESLAKAERDTVMKMWEGLGYYRRARMLHEAAEQMTELPDSYEGWLNVKGVGEYTAAAIASICFDEAIPAIDGNVNRVVSRYFAVEERVDTSAGKKKIRNHAETLLDVDRPGDFNEAMMELGATVCRPKKPDCESCPVQSGCAGKVSPLEFPKKTPKKKATKWNPSVVVATYRDQIRLAKEPGDGLLSDLWGVEHFENAEALKAAYSEAVSVGSVKHKFTHRDTTYDVWTSQMSSIESSKDAVWVSVSDIDGYAVSTAMKKVIAAFLEWRNDET